MPAKILHISDLHFGPSFVPEVAEALLSTIPSIVADAIFVRGGLTQRAGRYQFERAMQLPGRLSDSPMLVIPVNNHVALWRIFETLFGSYALDRNIISPELDTILHVGFEKEPVSR